MKAWIFIIICGVVMGINIGSFTERYADRPKQKTVRLYIQDWTTGCEYIQNPNGGITPRIDVDYMHKGCKGLGEEAK